MAVPVQFLDYLDGAGCDFHDLSGNYNMFD